MSNLAILVDEQDAVLGTKDRFSIESGDIIRISSLWLENDKGEVLLSKRSLQKKHDPGLWAAAAAGTLEPDETYESNIYKEADEEIGLKDTPFTGFKHWMFWRADGTGRYVTMYKAIVNKAANEFTLQKEEVDEVRWFDKPYVRRRLKTHPQEFVGSAKSWEVMLLI